MNRSAYTLRDVTADRVIIECPRCNRRGDYATSRLIERFGADMRLPELKGKLVNCPESNPAATLVGCASRYSAETVASWMGEGGAPSGR